jgi:uncharacterized coiled-coil protein SlyX
MPTQEERLSTLEQTVAVLNRGIWDINHNETMLLGMFIKQDENIQEVKSSLAALSEHLNTFEQNVNSHFGALDGHVGALDGRVGALDGRVGALDNRIGALDGRVGALDDRVGAFEQRVSGRFETLEQSINSRFEGQDKKFDQILLLLKTLIPKPE